MAASKSSDALKRATGRDYDAWFAALDRWGATKREYREIAAWLTEKHGFSTWWAQKVIVEYQEARGVRAPGVRRGGTFTVTATKTINVPASRAFQAFTDAKIRRRWLEGAKLRKRTADEPRSARFDWGDDGSILAATFLARGTAKTQVAIEHSKLPDQKTADRTKAWWRQRLSDLKQTLERDEPSR